MGRHAILPSTPEREAIRAADRARKAAQRSTRRGRQKAAEQARAWKQANPLKAAVINRDWDIAHAEHRNDLQRRRYRGRERMKRLIYLQFVYLLKKDEAGRKA